MLDAIQWLKIACDEVTSTIIQNCFHHVGFKTDSTPLPEHDTSLDIAGVLEDLRTNGVHVEGQVKDFTNIDSDLEAAGTLTDEDIVATVFGTMDDNEDDADIDDQDDPIICPTNSDYRKAMHMDVVRSLIIRKIYVNMKAVHSLEKLFFTFKHKETTVDDYLTCCNLIDSFSTLDNEYFFSFPEVVIIIRV